MEATVVDDQMAYSTTLRLSGGRAILQESLCDGLIGALCNGLRSPISLVEIGFGVLRNADELLGLAVPGPSSATAWRESRNKLSAFGLFVNADQLLTTAPPRDNRLRDAVLRASALEPYRRLWTTEGLGFYHAVESLEADGKPRPLLSREELDGIPTYCWVALHTGISLALASVALRKIPNSAANVEVRRSIEAYLVDCRGHCLDGYEGMAIEALGLVAGITRRELVPMLDREFMNIEQRLAAKFWHGYGRGLYFSPSSLMPCSSVIFPGLYRLKQECPHRLARANILAGLAWAVALVNIRDPDVIAAFIRRNVSGPLEREAFADGMQSAATIWRDWSPYSPLLQSLCDYRPANGSQETRLLWDQTGRGHCSEEFEAAYHRLKQRGSMDELFQFRANDAGSD